MTATRYRGVSRAGRRAKRAARRGDGSAVVIARGPGDGGERRSRRRRGAKRR